MSTLNYDEYWNIINEGFIIKDDIVYFDPTSKEIVDTKFGKGNFKPYESKLPFGKFYSLYKQTKDGEKEDYNKVLNSLKGTHNIQIDQNSYWKFLDRTSIFYANFIKQFKIDTILTIQSSSNLNNDFTTRLQMKLPSYYQIFTYHDGIFKNPNFEEIFANTENTTLSDQRKKELDRKLEKAKEKGYFKIHDIFGPQRKLIENWLKLDNHILSHIYDKNVLVIDDVTTSGSSFIEASKRLEDAGAKSMTGICLIKGKD